MAPPEHSSGPPLIRSARPDDINTLERIERDSFPSDWLSRRQMRYHLSNPRAIFLVCEFERSQPAGYVLCFLRKNAAARIYSLAVSLEARGSGLGRALMQTALHELKKRKQHSVMIEVRKSDLRTRKFYISLGFNECRELPGYYEDGADGIKMMISLEQT